MHYLIRHLAQQFQTLLFTYQRARASVRAPLLTPASRHHIPWETDDDGSSICLLTLIGRLSLGLLASFLLIPGYCRHLGSKPTNDNPLFLYLCVLLSLSSTIQINLLFKLHYLTYKKCLIKYYCLPFLTVKS